MTAKSNDSSTPSTPSPVHPAKQPDFSTLSEYMQKREKLNHELHEKMRRRFQEKGIRTL